MLNIPPELELSNHDFLTVIQSLNRRCLLEKVTQNGAIFFKLNSIFNFTAKKNIKDGVI